MLSLIELQNKKVEAKRKKYEKDEMDEYLQLVFDNYKQLLEENKKLESEKTELNKKIKTLSDGVQYYRSIETTLQKALILAEKTSKETKDAAILKAEAIEREAHKRAETIIQRAEAQYTQIHEKSVQLVQQFNQYKLQLKEAANAQLQLIDGNEFDLKEPITEPIMTAVSSPTSSAEDVVVEDIVPETSPVTESVNTNSVNLPTTEPSITSVENINSDVATVESPKKEENIAEFDTSKEELLNADTIDLSNTLDAVKTETDELATTNDVTTSSKDVTSPAMVTVKEATIVEPVVAKTIDASPVSFDSKEEPKTEEPKVEVNSVSSMEPSLEQVLEEKKEASAQETTGGIPTLDSLLQDLNMNNKSNQKSDDPFEFLGSIDDDF